MLEGAIKSNACSADNAQRRVHQAHREWWQQPALAAAPWLKCEMLSGDPCVTGCLSSVHVLSQLLTGSELTDVLPCRCWQDCC